jgi:hypothetical protein
VELGADLGLLLTEAHSVDVHVGFFGENDSNTVYVSIDRRAVEI